MAELSCSPRDHSAITGDDTVDVLGTAISTVFGLSASDRQQRIAHCPYHQVTGVQTHRILPRHPLHRLAGNVEPKNTRHAFKSQTESLA